MGQFATPANLAVDIQRYAKMHLGKNERVRFIDPAIGTGSFYSALLEVFPQSRIGAAVGYEIAPHYGSPAVKLWGGTGLDIRLEDFTQAEAPKAAERFNLLICNPPYVRHHHIVNGDRKGNPVLERRLFLLDPPWQENEIRERYPKLWVYLEEGKAEGIADRYLCRHRTLWYTQEYRPRAPFVCTYLGRSDKRNGRPFRFILNNSKATAAAGKASRSCWRNRSRRM